MSSRQRVKNILVNFEEISRNYSGFGYYDHKSVVDTIRHHISHTSTFRSLGQSIRRPSPSAGLTCFSVYHFTLRSLYPPHNQPIKFDVRSHLELVAFLLFKCRDECGIE